MINKYERAADAMETTIWGGCGASHPNDKRALEFAITLLRAAAKLKPGVDAAKILEMHAAGELVEREEINHLRWVAQTHCDGLGCRACARERRRTK